MNRRVLNYGIMAALVVAAVFASCSSPEKDGIKVAKKYCDCERVRLKMSQKTLKKNQREYSKFIEEFQSYNFKTQKEVSNKVREIDDNIQQMNNGTDTRYYECSQKVNEYERKMCNKNLTEQKREQFYYAYENYCCAKVKNEKFELLNSQIENLRTQIENLSLSVIPPKLDMERIENDIIERINSENQNE